MSQLTHEFISRLLDGTAPKEGVLGIKVLSIDTDSVMLSIEVVDPNNGHTLIELEVIRILNGDVIELRDIQRAFKIKIK